MVDLSRAQPLSTSPPMVELPGTRSLSSLRAMLWQIIILVSPWQYLETSLWLERLAFTILTCGVAPGQGLRTCFAPQMVVLRGPRPPNSQLPMLLAATALAGPWRLQITSSSLEHPMMISRVVAVAGNQAPAQHTCTRRLTAEIRGPRCTSSCKTMQGQKNGSLVSPC